MDAARVRIAATTFILGLSAVVLAPATATAADTQPPNVTLTQPTAGSYVGRTATLTATATDDVGVDRVEFFIGATKVATSSVAPYRPSVSTSGFPDGPQTIRATAYDDAGHQDSDSVSVTIDGTSPSLAVQGPNGETFPANSTQEWTISASDATSGVASVQCKLTGPGQAGTMGPCSEGSSGHSVSDLDAGTYTFTAKVTDHAGNTGSVARTFSIDATPPETTLTGGPSDGSSQTAGSATFTFTSDDSSASFQCRVYANGTTAPAFQACTDPGADTITGLGLGTYRFDVRAIDVPGNPDPSPASRSFSVVAPAQPTEPTPIEPTPTPTPTPSAPVFAPQTSIDIHPNHKMHKKRARFAFSSSDASATFECSLDGAPFAPCTSPTKVKVKPGKHVFAVRAVGASALRDATPASWRWKVKRKHHRRHHG